MKLKFLSIFFAAAALCSSCEDFLTREPMDQMTDTPDFWNNPENYRLEMYAFYDVYFPGYNVEWSRSNYFSETNIADWNDDNAQKSPTLFTKVAPTKVSESSWDYNYVRRHNLLVNRAQNSSMAEADKAHWEGVARFFRGLEYADLVAKFGDVPYIDQVLENTDQENLFTPRTPRATVMENVLADLQFACENIKVDDGVKGLNIDRGVALAFTSRIMLFEGTWQKYREGNNEAAKKFLQAAKDAAEKLMGMNYSLHNNWRELTSSESLAGNTECILYREYVDGICTHSLMSFQNTEAEGSSPSRSLIDSYLSSNGLPINQAENNLYKGDKWFYDEIADRDPRLYGNIDVTGLRLENVFGVYATSGYYANRFVNEDLKDKSGGVSFTNITDAPIIKLNEVMMNYIEAAVELNTLGAYNLTQADFDKTINALRDRETTSMPHVTYSNGALSVNGVVINDPDRDLGYAEVAGDYEVDPVVWEVRRERRVELPYEGIRFDDLRRWSKLHYADMIINKKLNLGAWLDKDQYIAWYNAENPDAEEPLTLENLKSIKLDREGNAGYIVPASLDPSLLRTYSEKDYLYPIPTDEIELYDEYGYVLTQNPGW